MTDFSSSETAKIVNSAAGRICRRYGLEHEETRQDIWVEILGGLPYDSTRSKLSTFIYSRSRSVATRAVRPRSVRATTGLTIGTPWEQVERDELAETDSGIGDYLTGDSRTDAVIVGLSEGRTKKEIASLLGTSVDTVKRICRKLKRGYSNE